MLLRPRGLIRVIAAALATSEAFRMADAARHQTL
jgi:hypothetical protein